jgi:hypothetical protein
VDLLFFVSIKLCFDARSEKLIVLMCQNLVLATAGEALSFTNTWGLNKLCQTVWRDWG